MYMRLICAITKVTYLLAYLYLGQAQFALSEKQGDVDGCTRQKGRGEFIYQV